MHLFHRQIGYGYPFVVLHGLYGASDNWVSFARSISKKYEFFLPDMRNHGQSRHSNEFDYQTLSNDIYEWLQANNIRQPIIMGHSMGGKTAMQLALQHSDCLSALIVLDISPLSYPLPAHDGLLNHEYILRAMSAIDLSKYKHRTEVDEELAKHIHDTLLCKMLQKNIARARDGSFFWRLNLNALHSNLTQLQAGITGMPCQAPCLFIKGEKSGYINHQDIAAIKNLFPCSTFEEITNAGHFLHVEQPTKLQNIVENFLQNEIKI